MDWKALLDKRPIMVAVAGSNGAGKSSFYHSHLSSISLPFINADVLAKELDLGAYEAAEIATGIRATLTDQKESFVFETVFSDPCGAKVAELESAVRQGFHVVLIFIRIDSAETSKQRVSMRVMQGGHDVPDEKLEARFDRTVANLDRAIQRLPVVIIFDNTNLATPYKLEAVYKDGAAL